MQGIVSPLYTHTGILYSFVGVEVDDCWAFIFIVKMKIENINI